MTTQTYTSPASDWLDRQIAETARIKAEIIALTGCEDRVAQIAAGSFVAFRNAPDHGLSGHPDTWNAGKARVALDAWKQTLSVAKGLTGALRGEAA